jgi:hypothetical protein
MEICGARYGWDTDVAFCPPPHIPVPLLGHHGFFEHFKIRFKTAARQFRIHLR